MKGINVTVSLSYTNNSVYRKKCEGEIGVWEFGFHTLPEAEK
jgi:hypothetical protein